jgi:hypothetical protein
MRATPVTLAKFGFKEVKKDYPDHAKIVNLLGKKYIADHDPDITYWTKDGKEYALVGHACDGHGLATIFELKG